MENVRKVICPAGKYFFFIVMAPAAADDDDVNVFLTIKANINERLV